MEAKIKKNEQRMKELNEDLKQSREETKKAKASAGPGSGTGTGTGGGGGGDFSNEEK